MSLIKLLFHRNGLNLIAVKLNKLQDYISLMTSQIRYLRSCGLRHGIFCVVPSITILTGFKVFMNRCHCSLRKMVSWLLTETSV